MVQQVTFQPVMLNVFPALPIVIVLSHIPGNVAVMVQIDAIIKFI